MYGAVLAGGTELAARKFERIVAVLVVIALLFMLALAAIFTFLQ